MKEKAGLQCVLSQPWAPACQHAVALGPAHARPTQATGPAPSHSCLLSAFFLASLPNSQTSGVVFHSWLFSAMTNSSSACSLIRLSLSGSPSLAVCLGPSSKGWMLRLTPSLPFPSLGRVPGPTCSLLSSVISHPYGAMTGLFPLCPPEASSEQQPGTEYTSQPLTRSDFWSWASWVWEAAERESTGSESKT